jgi:Lipase (class 3)
MRVRRHLSPPRAFAVFLVVVSLATCQFVLQEGTDSIEQQQQCVSSEGVLDTTCSGSDRVDDNSNPSDENDGLWSPQQLWDGSRDIFQRIFGTTAASEEEAGGGNGDPFYNLAEGRHDAAPSSSPQGFFESLWAGAQGRPNADVKKGSQPPDLFQAFQSIFGSGDKKDEEDPDRAAHESTMWEDVLVTRFMTSKQTMLEDSVGIKMERFKATFAEMSTQLQRTFQHVPIDRLNLLQVYYAMQHEESIKDPVWKRRQHRSLPDLKEKEAIALFDGMYLSYLSYVESCADVHQGLQQFYGGAWVLVNCTTVGQPLRPAHFLAVKRQSKEKQQPESSASGADFWQPLLGGGDKRKELEVVLVIRGTKDLGDAFSDALLEAAEYRDGHAHDGILKSAQWIHDTYREWILHLREVSKSTHVRLWLVGHSLGYVRVRERDARQPPCALQHCFTTSSSLFTFF